MRDGDTAGSNAASGQVGRWVAMTMQLPHDDEYRRRVAALRGALPAAPLGARELAQFARSQECDRLLAHLLARLDPAAVTRLVFRGEVRDEGSHLALAAGITFEHTLLKDGGAALFDMYRRAGRLAEAEDTLINVEAMAPGADPDALAERERVTRDFLARKLAGDPAAPSILWHPRLVMEVDGAPTVIEPDLLTASAAEPFYRPGEVKSYRDRGPRTNPADVATARLQGAVEVLALRDTLRRLGASAAEAERLAPDRFDLVLRRRLGMRPSLRPTTIRRDVATMRRILRGVRPRMLRVLEQLQPGATLDSEAGHDAVPNRLTESCRAHCAFAARCEALARRAGAPIVLGAAMEEAVGVVGSLPRLAALLAGRVRPRNDDEARIAHDFREARVITDREVRRAG